MLGPPHSIREDGKLVAEREREMEQTKSDTGEPEVTDCA